MIKITCDSVCDLPSEFLKKYDINIVHHYIKNKYGIFKDHEEITSKNLIEYVETTGEFPLTLPPSVTDYKAFFEEHSKDTEALIHIVISDKISLSCENAFEAAKNFNNVYIVNSENVTIGCGIIVIKACELAAKGLPVYKILKQLSDYSDLVYTSFVIPNLNYLYSTGRVPDYGFKIMKILRCRPTLIIKNGKITPEKYYFSTKEAYYKKYIKRLLKGRCDIDTDTVYIVISNNSFSFINYIKEQISLYQNFKNIIVTEASSTITANCGNEAFGIVLLLKNKQI